MIQNRRPVWAILTILILLALALSLTPVRAWASSFLGLFRVQNITVIPFDPVDAQEAAASLSQEDAVKVLMKEVSIERGGEIEPAASSEEAAAKAGFTPRLPAALEGASLAVQPWVTARYTIDQPRLQALIDELGLDTQIPPSTDGQDITVEAPSAVLATLGCQPAAGHEDLPGDCTSFVQLPSPVVSTPDDLDLPGMGKAMLQFLGLPEDEAAQLSQRIDWTSTLVLPIPQGEGVTYQEVTVDGVTGTLVQDESEGYVLVWVKDGMLYGLRGPGGVDEALGIANTIQ